MEKVLSVLTLGLVSLNLIAFSPISATSNVDNAIATEDACAGECYTRFQTAADADKCDKIWTEKSLTAPGGFTGISIMEDAVASL